MRFTRFGYFVKVVNIKVIGAMRTHVQLANTEVN